MAQSPMLVVSVLVLVAVWWWAEAGEASCQPAEGESITLLSALPSTDIQLDFRLPLFTRCQFVVGNGGEKLKVSSTFTWSRPSPIHHKGFS